MNKLRHTFLVFPGGTPAGNHPVSRSNYRPRCASQKTGSGRRGLEFWYRISQNPSLIWKKRHYHDLHMFVLPAIVQAAKLRLGGSR